MSEKDKTGHRVSASTEDIGGTIRRITKREWIRFTCAAGYNYDHARKLVRGWMKEPWVLPNDGKINSDVTQANSGFYRVGEQRDHASETSQRNGAESHGRPPKGEK